uniref:Uncharacterized protein n=1 Tax=Cacopsylla melanoneura TaxID=428564 RepID=A0A8D9ABE9_9HEMI
MNLSMLPPIPNDWRDLIIFKRHVISKALTTSRKIAIVCSRLAIPLATSFSRITRLSIVDLLFLPPLWKLFKTPLFSSVQNNLLFIIFSNTLPVQLSKEIGRKLLVNKRSLPGFNRGIIRSLPLISGNHIF